MPYLFNDRVVKCPNCTGMEFTFLARVEHNINTPHYAYRCMACSILCTFGDQLVPATAEECVGKEDAIPESATYHTRFRLPRGFHNQSKHNLFKE